MAAREDGVELLEAGQWEEAIARLDESLLVASDEAETYYHRGVGYLNLAWWDASIPPFTTFAPGARIRPGLGSVFRDKGLLDMAFADLDQAIALNPTLGDAFYNRGLIYMIRALHRDAVGEFDQTIALNPTHADAHYNRGVANLLLGDLDDAAADLDEAAALDDEHAEALFALGMTHSTQKRWFEAIGAFDRAIAIDPRYADAFYGRATAHGLSGNLSAAKVDLQSFIEHAEPTSPVVPRAEQWIEELEAGGDPFQ